MTSGANAGRGFVVVTTIGSSDVLRITIASCCNESVRFVRVSELELSAMLASLWVSKCSSSIWLSLTHSLKVSKREYGEDANSCSVS
jgi:hypothetical protein